MRKLEHYSMGEWFTWKPLDHLLIEVCNDALQLGFRKRKPKVLERFIQDCGHLEGSDIGLVIAYEQPWSLNWLLKMAARHLASGTLLVFDNSRWMKSRVKIERVCRDNGVPYLGLPFSPTPHPNRSHGMAMTYVFYNVVLTLKPRTFTFIDHDLIPMARIELGRALGDQPFYGLPDDSKWAWSLWAGYCSYDYSSVCHLPLNFLNDFSNGLDTGGRNWPLLYRNYQRSRVRFGTLHKTDVTDPFSGTTHPVDVVDKNWIHLGGASYSSKFLEMTDFYERIAQATEEGATLSSLGVKSWELVRGRQI
jgi:hypothetical protein